MRIKQAALKKSMTMKAESGISGFLEEKFAGQSLQEINRRLRRIAGIEKFFLSKADCDGFCKFVQRAGIPKFSAGGREWGDIQTPKEMSDKICNFLRVAGFKPDIILEPTYGTGNFLLSAIEKFPSVKKIYGIELRMEHDWAFKAALLEKFSKSQQKPPKIRVHRGSIFSHRFDLKFFSGKQALLIIGNPPWVTNAELSALESANVPIKSNFKRLQGMDALTGKSNFDLGECVILRLLEAFAKNNGKLAMLCKRTVIKNIVKNLPNSQYSIRNLQAIPIDAKKVFNKSVDAALFLADLGRKSSEYACSEAAFHSPKTGKKFGWVNDCFVADADNYKKCQDIEGASHLAWRSGIKHDCSPILELRLDKARGLLNGLNEKISIEDGCIFPLLKGSMLKNFVVSSTDRRLLVLQKSISDNTDRLRALPKLWKYLCSKSEYFDRRKSVMHHRKYQFSIFGVGSYSFLPYKVAICGMRKEPFFSICLPVHGKPMVFDDTCYFLGFEDRNAAVFAGTALNSEASLNFLKSLAFVSSKRPYTKEILSRISISKIADRLAFRDIKKIWEKSGFDGSHLSERDYEIFKQSMR